MYTVLILTIFNVVITTNQYSGDPIHCWFPAVFKDSFVDYAKNYCWISNKYYIPFDESVSRNPQIRRQHEIAYYQWVPIILTIMALLFKIPNIIWQMCNGHSGINLEMLEMRAESTQMGSCEDIEKAVRDISHFIHRWVTANNGYKKRAHSCRRKCTRFLNSYRARDGRFLTKLYVLCKCLFVFNVIGQFFLLNAFLSSNFSFIGIDILTGSLDASLRFPRITFCDFIIRQYQNIQQYTVQCVLPNNMLNEKIFIFLWFWLVLVSAVSVTSLLIYCYKLLISRNYNDCIKEIILYADKMAMISSADSELVRHFVDNHLRIDGVFVLRSICSNTNKVMLYDLTIELWKLFLEKNGKTSEILDIGNHMEKQA